MSATSDARPERSPGIKLLLAMLVAVLLSVPLFAVYLLVYDRQTQSATAHDSIAEGWGGPQTIAGPVLVVPYLVTGDETVTENGKPVTRRTSSWHELAIAPAAADIASVLQPQIRRRSIYESVVYEAHNRGSARFVLPTDLARRGIAREALALDRAELRFGVSDARGLVGGPPRVLANGALLALQPGNGPAETGGAGFFTALDARTFAERPLVVAYDYIVRGNSTLSLLPQGGDTRWSVVSSWASPGFHGTFLPGTSSVGKTGFHASWRVGNLALGRALVATDPGTGSGVQQGQEAQVDLVNPVDIYAQVDRSVKYGFLFIGFTFLAFLMFDLVGGARVSPVEYALVGAGLVLFFAMLLGFAEVAGFALAYAIAASAIIALLAAYSAAVLRSRRRGAVIAGLLVTLYGVLYVLLSLEDLSLLIGSLLLFAALASVMYLTRRIDWGGRATPAIAPDAI